MEWMIDIIKVVIPMGLLVLLAYVLLNQLINAQIRLKSIELSREKKKDTLELKLNAYERLALYMERISFPDLIMRVNADKMEAYTLYSALLMTIQREFEHNLSQQIYVSENLWNIIKLAKQDLANMITESYGDLTSKDSQQYIDDMLKRYNQWNPNPLEAAKSAIRQEASLLL